MQKADEQQRVPPAVARRFTAVQVAGIAMTDEAGELAEQDQSEFAELFRDFDWPDHLRTRMAEFLSNGQEREVEYNPFLGERQVLLLVTQYLRRRDECEQLIAWTRAYGFGAEELDYLSSQIAEVGLEESTTESRLADFLDPPDRLLDLVEQWHFELSIGVPALEPIDHIQPHQYEHPWDREALDRMRDVTGFETALRKFSEWHLEKLQHLTSQSTRIRVGPEQFPELFDIWRICCERSQMGSDRPDLFVEYGSLNAFTTGVEKPQVVVSSALVSLLDRTELMFVLGHELGHIRSEHVLYYMFAQWLPTVVDAVGQATLGIGKVIGEGMQLAVLDWQRKSELTCDRHGLLVAQDLDAAVRVMMKLAGAPPTMYGDLNTEAFIEQGREFDGEKDIQNEAYKFFLTANQDHPWPAVRAHLLDEWESSGDYETLLDGTSAAEENDDDSACPYCCKNVLPGDEFCPHCGSDLRAAAAAQQAGLECPECNSAAVEENDQFCPDCGADLDQQDNQTGDAVSCHSCGSTVLEPSDSYCPECGAEA